MPQQPSSAAAWAAGTGSAGRDDLDLVSTLLRVADATRSRLTTVLDRSGVTWAQYEILESLDKARCPMSYRMLATVLQRHRTSITATVSGLLALGYIDRWVAPDSRSTTMIEATEPGVHALRRAKRVLAAYENDLVDPGAVALVEAAIRR
ncbi:MarR family winged helix-turn-helix transcriptional regulator [Rhodococcoides kyotonense]|uniref:HTH marR-type domain-containing protein n=1 Tax=Rhodococcoides kyotonense TaxID=398843 RepID=A0A239NEB4_9NOCA|nr:hypothetical protein [Rhodococcus kyotonensis]SNT53307.1 hypothetical protein SAMN05421642_1388 [Rhodococcus kyotonensis]